MTSGTSAPVDPVPETSHFDLPSPILPFVDGAAITTITDAGPVPATLDAGSCDFVLAADILQRVADYRTRLRDWFAVLRVGGRLAIAVPHAFLAERALALPSRPQTPHRRLYTPAVLLGEVEEALEPNSYRVRLLCDHDAGYDYAAEDKLDGERSVLLVIERIEQPDWAVDGGEVAPAPAPSFAFEPARTRREIVALAPRKRIVILKLDHLGDFMMSIPALEKARAAFTDADITLVVGSWNVAMARDLDLFETVLGFDAFPRNSSEERVDLAGRVADFERLLSSDYDLAIDLRCDPDTRFFLRHLNAAVRAGLGTRAQFDFLDIFLPVDGTRHGFEAVSDQEINHHAHVSAACCRRSAYRIAYGPYDPEENNPTKPFLMFGPYLSLAAGDYLYQPHLEIEGEGQGLLSIDVACDMVQVAHALVTTGAMPGLRFRVDKPGTQFEFRIASLPGRETPSFSFYGGRLLRAGASSVLHQSEYLSLLIELVAMRTDRFGLLREDPDAS